MSNHSQSFEVRCTYSEYKICGSIDWTFEGRRYFPRQSECVAFHTLILFDPSNVDRLESRDQSLESDILDVIHISHDAAIRKGDVQMPNELVSVQMTSARSVPQEESTRAW